MFESILEILKTFGLYFIQILISIPCALVVVLVHNYAQSITAYCLGDKSLKKQGYLSINPVNHIEPIGFLCLALFRFGWSSTIPFNKRNFKHPKLYVILSVLAGFLANVLLGFFFAFLVFLVTPNSTPAYAHIIEFILKLPLGDSIGIFAFSLFQNTVQTMCVLNLTFVIFNLFPLPPLQGFSILSLFIPKYATKSVLRVEKYIVLALLVVLLLDFYFIGIITPALGAGVNFVLNKCFLPLFIKIF